MTVVERCLQWRVPKVECWWRRCAICSPVACSGAQAFMEAVCGCIVASYGNEANVAPLCDFDARPHTGVAIIQPW